MKMKKLVIAALALAVVIAGCKKAAPAGTNDTNKVEAAAAPAAEAPAK